MIKQFFRMNTAIGINLKISQNGALNISACQITKKGDQLDFDHKLTAIASLEELAKQLSNKIPVALNLSGKGVLIKQVEKLLEVTPDNFNRLLPNANFEDFYFQNFISGDGSFISIIRKADADTWLQEFDRLGYAVASLSIGPFAVSQVLLQLNFYNEQIVFDGHIISRNDQENWDSYKSDESVLASFPLKIESEKIDERLLIAYTVAFQLLLMDQLELVQAYSPITYRNLKLITDKIWIKAYSAAALVVVFLLLIVNFFINDYYQKENARLAIQMSKFTQNSSNADQTKLEIAKKENELQALGWEGVKSKASLIDQLAAVLPVEIKWTEVVINPLNATKSREQKLLSFTDRQIRITGMSSQIIPVNEWMARIKLMSWVKNIQMESYLPDSEKQTGIFILKLTY